ncbi:MAG: hypothetical protein EBR79_02945 [Proteobacteria bacterium]|nr:hypothetical protein [Pseudomonadota bacterium]NBX85793.1 hypothetical protein [Pseudomonadota bacterium]
MRRLFTLMLLAAAAGIIWLLYANVQESRLFRLSTIPTPPTAQNPTTTISLTTVSTTNVLENPRFTGQDDKNRRWEITAQQANQHGSTTSGTLHLTTVSATLNLPENQQSKTQTNTITLNAQQAAYTQNTQQLQLNGRVTLQGRGLLLQAPAMQANLANQSVAASGGVRATLQLSQKGAQ